MLHLCHYLLPHQLTPLCLRQDALVDQRLIVYITAGVCYGIPYHCLQQPCRCVHIPDLEESRIIYGARRLGGNLGQYVIRRIYPCIFVYAIIGGCCNLALAPVYKLAEVYDEHVGLGQHYSSVTLHL